MDTPSSTNISTKLVSTKISTSLVPTHISTRLVSTHISIYTSTGLVSTNFTTKLVSTNISIRLVLTTISIRLVSTNIFTRSVPTNLPVPFRLKWCVFQDFVGDLSPEETVQRLSARKGHVAMERFRSLQDKLLLLDYAVSGNDGNTITAVLIFMKRTLSKELWGEWRTLRYVPETSQSHTATLWCESGCSLIGRLSPQLLQYKEHLNISDENKRRDFLKSCISLPFSAEDAALVQDHFTLLERQIIIEAADSQAEKSGKSNVFQKFPRKASILNMPLITTLYYCVYYHYHESEGSYSSPSNLRQTFKVSEKQFFTSALSALSKLKSWSEVDSLFSSKSWLGFSRKKSPLSYGRVVDILHKNSAPSSVLVQYVALVEDPEQRLALAQKHKCHDIVINTFRDMKDRQMLVQYRDKVERGSDEERKITDLLNNSQIRWKN
uniref:Spermatogenesis-defective protein 39 homolog n=1 Tax=Neogobius melanostomus TaxID=47308 RepID=A0A8C6SZP3_9GOBI